MSSCLLVGLTSMYVQPDTMTIGQLGWLMTRDLLIIGAHTSMLVIYSLDSICSDKTSVKIFIIADIVAAFLRLVKNPMQFLANQRLYNNNDRGREGFAKMFSSDYAFLSMRLYTAVDWLAYLIWIYGTFSVNETLGGTTEQCESPLLTMAQYEILISSLGYVFGMSLFASMFLVYRATQGRVFPGFRMYNMHWPDSCPAIYFDRSQWRQPSEPLPQYRQRVVQTFHLQMAPRETTEMSTQRGMTRQELSQLQTMHYAHDIIVMSPVSKSTDTTCALCLEDYKPGDRLREMPCEHKFHCDCVDEWLLSKAKCPVCQQEIEH